MTATQTYNFKSVISGLREISTDRGTFAVGKLVREGKRDTNIKITDSALTKARAAGLDLSGPVDLFGRFEAKPFTNDAGESKTAQIFVVLAVSAIKSREEIAAIRAAKAGAPVEAPTETHDDSIPF